MMNAPIFNRDGKAPADHWFQIEVSGEHPAGDHGLQVIDEVAMRSIVNRFKQESAQENFPGLLVDADHLSHDLENDTAALAWLKDLEIRNNQLHGLLDLTDLGEPAVTYKRYKFFSTEYDPADLEDLGNGRVRPKRLAGLAFTNRPNNRGGKPISNRDGKVPSGQKPETHNTMQPIATKLGLPADADEAAVLQKITDIMSELEALKGKQAEGEAEEIMNRFGSRIPKEKREDVKKRLIANRADTVAMLELLPEPSKVDPPARIHNREDATTPAAVGDGVSNKEAETKAAAIRNRAGEISAKEGLPFNQAFNRAAAELG